MRCRWFALAGLALALGSGCKPAGTPGSKSASGTQFTLREPRAKNVYLAGEFNHWKTTATPMRRDASGLWSVAVPLRAGTYNYKFFVDGKWLVDPANPDLNPDGFGGKNSLITVVDPFADPVVTEKATVSGEAARKFARKDFASLEKEATELRRTKARFSDGLWKLMEFYNGLQAENEMGGQKDWQPWFAKLEQWHRAFPDSITQPVVLARGWTDYAWEARGNGNARSVSGEGSRLFDERLQRARAVLEAAPQKDGRCPNWYGVMQNVALGQGWPLDEADKLLAEAVKAEPTFYAFYWNAAWFRMPRWYGREGDWERFAENARTRFDPEEGMSVYTRIAWDSSRYYSNLFRQTAITWPKMRQGFLDIAKQYPDSRWNLNAFARFAVMAEDRATAQQLFQRIGEHGDAEWGYGSYELDRAWADPKTPSWRIEPFLTLSETGIPAQPIETVAFSPDGKWVAGGGRNGRVTVWNATTAEEAWSVSVTNDAVMSVVFSPDGKQLAVGAGESTDATRPGVIKVWDFATKKLLASAQPNGTVRCLAYAPDGRSLAAAGGVSDTMPEVSILDLATQKLRVLEWPAIHDNCLHAVAIAPDGRTLATDWFQSISVWSLAENRMVLDTRDLLDTFVQKVAFSPDGRTLAVAGTPSWDHHSRDPGSLTLWDTETWKERTPTPRVEPGGLFAIAYSRDGKWIAGGSEDQAIHVWAAETLQERTSFITHDGIISAVAFSPDGKTIASGSVGGTVKLWSLRP